MWAAQFLKMKGPGKFITSGGLGTMGFGLPAALGIGVNDKNKKIIVISGDGSFQMNFAELATASEQDLNLKIFLFNNSSLSLVKQLQYFSQNKRYSGIKFKKNPDFCKLATAYRTHTKNPNHFILNQITSFVLRAPPGAWRRSVLSVIAFSHIIPQERLS